MRKNLIIIVSFILIVIAAIIASPVLKEDIPAQHLKSAATFESKFDKVAAATEKHKLVSQFIINLDDEKISQMFSDVAFLFAIDSNEGFNNTNDLTCREIFNLYASTKAVQDKINEGYDSGKDIFYVDIPLTDLQAFINKYFGNYNFDVKKLVDENGTIKYDEAKKSISLLSVNGGCASPPGLDPSIVDKKVTSSGDLVNILVTRRWDYDSSSYRLAKALLVVRPTQDAFQFVSFHEDTISDNFHK